MTAAKTKANVGLALLTLFLITFITGIILHLKSHGTIIEPRRIIKIVHWTAGLLMTALMISHAIQFKKVLVALKKRFLWFWLDSRIAEILTLLTFVTGFVKLCSPVKIPHLGLWHYAIGIALAVIVAIHLVRGIPAWNRLRK